LPLENPFLFYPKYIGNLVYKHFTLARLIVRYGLLRATLKRDPDIRNYMDEALMPVHEEFSEPVSNPAATVTNIVNIASTHGESLAAR